MKKRKFLFVCFANENRSPTAERVFRELLEKGGYKVTDDLYSKRGKVVLSAGFEPSEKGRRVSRELCDSVDEILVMNRWMIDELAEKYGQEAGKVTTLDIPDVYGKDDPELMSLLSLKLREYLELKGY
ncbi:MAG: hypothetical protein AABX29_07245 [Nanoarchaeota archaeon]